jgi:hypothetical protein
MRLRHADFCGKTIEIKRKGIDMQSKSYNTKWNKIEFEFEKQQQIPYKK